MARIIMVPIQYPGKYISAGKAYEHVFGHMVAMDISDRGGRPPGGLRRHGLVCRQSARETAPTSCSTSLEYPFILPAILDQGVDDEVCKFRAFA